MNTKELEVGFEFTATKAYPFEENIPSNINEDRSFDITDGEQGIILEVDKENDAFKVLNVPIDNWFIISKADLLKIQS